MTKADVIRDVLRADPDGSRQTLAALASKKLRKQVKPVEISNYRTKMRSAGEIPNGESLESHYIGAVPSPTEETGPKRLSLFELAVSLGNLKSLVAQFGKVQLKGFIDVLEP